MMIVAMAGCTSIGAQNVANYTVTASATSPIRFSVTKVEYRKDLTRVYGRLIGKPHTAARIDEISITLKNGKTLKATDIDGIDLKRWFQWEDEGVVEVEIDFPPMKKQKGFTITATTPRGDSVWTVK